MKKSQIIALLILITCTSASLANYVNYFDDTISVFSPSRSLDNYETILFIEDGGMTRITAKDFSYIEVRGTASLGENSGINHIDINDNSSLKFLGGETNVLSLDNNATAVLESGSINFLKSYQNPGIDQSGLPIKNITIVCDIDSVVLTDDLLTGNWLDNGNSFSITLQDQAGYVPVIDNIQFIPEPASLILLGLGGLLLRKRKHINQHSFS